MDRWTEERRRLAAAYRDRLPRSLKRLHETTASPGTYHVFPVLIADRDALAAHLTAHGVASSIHYPVALPDQPALGAIDNRADTSTARRWAARELSIPIFPGMCGSELEAVIGDMTSWASTHLTLA